MTSRSTPKEVSVLASPPTTQDRAMNISKNDSECGLYRKFKVTRTDGRSARGEKHHDCEYFVLDLDHDPHALAALRAYGKSCAGEYPGLGSDLALKVARMAERFPHV